MRTRRAALACSRLVALAVTLTACDQVAPPPPTQESEAPPAPAPAESADLSIDRGLSPAPPRPPRSCDKWYALTRAGPSPVDMTLVVEASSNLDDALPPARHWSAVAGGIHDFTSTTTSVATISLVIAGDAHDPRTTYPSAVDVPRAPLDGSQRDAIDARLATTPAVDVTVHEVLGPALPLLVAEPLSVPTAKKVLVYVAAKNPGPADANAFFLAGKQLAPQPVFGFSLDPSTDSTAWVFDTASPFKILCGPNGLGSSCPPPSGLVTDSEVRSAISTGLGRAARWAHAACRFVPPPLRYPDEAAALILFDELGRELYGEWSRTRDEGWSVELDDVSCGWLETARVIEGYLDCPETP